MQTNRRKSGRAAGLPLLLAAGALLPVAPLWAAVPQEAAPVIAAPAAAQGPGVVAPVRVACVGDSITHGSGTKNPATDSYPAQLGRLLGDGWEVRNFGVSGATLLKHGDKPYWKERLFQAALDYQPNVVVLMLGTNDTKPQNWKYKGEFAADYRDLIERFAALPTKPRILVCYPIPVAGANHYGIRETGIQAERPMIAAVTLQEKVGVLDLYRVLEGTPALTPDTVHPNNEGAARMAQAVYQALTYRSFSDAAASPAPEPAAPPSR